MGIELLEKSVLPGDDEGSALIREIEAVGADLGYRTPYKAHLHEVARMCAEAPELEEQFMRLVALHRKVIID